MGQRILDSDAVNGITEVNKLRFWGHSHHTMGTSPSGQDNEQAEEFMKNGCDFFVRGIVNKHGKMEFTLYMASGIKMSDVPWAIYSPISERNRDKWKDDIKNLVTEKKYDTYNYRGEEYPYYNGNYNGGNGRDYNKVKYPEWMKPLPGHIKECRCKKCLENSIKELREKGFQTKIEYMD